MRGCASEGDCLYHHVRIKTSGESNPFLAPYPLPSAYGKLILVSIEGMDHVCFRASDDEGTRLEVYAPTISPSHTYILRTLRNTNKVLPTSQNVLAEKRRYELFFNIPLTHYNSVFKSLRL